MLIAENLSKIYGDYKALNNLNLKLNEGEIFCSSGAEWSREEHDN